MIIKNLVKIKELNILKTLKPPTVWLKGDEGVNLGSPVDGDAVFQWQDQSGNGNDFTQPSAIYQPEYKASLINGVPGIYFDGTTFLSLLSQVIFSVNEGSVWVVGQETGLPPNFTNGGGYWASNDGSLPPYMVLYSQRQVPFGLNIYFYDQFNGKSQNIIAQDNLPHFVGINKSATDVDYYADSPSQLATKSHVEDWTVYVEHFIADQIGLANGTMVGNICEFIAFDRYLSTSEIQSLTYYLSSKYGI